MARSYQLPHVLTYWKKTDDTDLYGKPVYVVGTKPCRYQSANRIYVNEYGQNQRSLAYVYTDDDYLSIGDIVIRGDFSSSPTPVPNAFEIKTERHTSNQRGDRQEHRYIL